LITAFPRASNVIISVVLVAILPSPDAGIIDWITNLSPLASSTLRSLPVDVVSLFVAISPVTIFGVIISRAAESLSVIISEIDESDERKLT
jgi:hypothetical protein